MAQRSSSSCCGMGGSSWASSVPLTNSVGPPGLHHLSHLQRVRLWLSLSSKRRPGGGMRADHRRGALLRHPAGSVRDPRRERRPHRRTGTQNGWINRSPSAWNHNSTYLRLKLGFFLSFFFFRMAGQGLEREELPAHMARVSAPEIRMVSHFFTGKGNI